MSFNYVLHAVKTALLVAPLLVGCGNNGGSNSTVPTGGITLNCSNPGSLLDPQGNCVAPPAGNLTVTGSCTSTQALSTLDGVTTYCVEKGTGTTSAGLMARINQDQVKITNLQNSLMQVSSAGGKAYYVGLSAVQPSAAITDPTTNKTGIIGASLICAAAFTGAHMCSVMEMYDSVANSNTADATNPDKFDPAVAIPNAWVYMEAWEQQVAGATQAAAGLNDNCAGYVYGTGDQKWQAVAVNWAANGTQLKFNINGCATSTNRIACCK